MTSQLVNYRNHWKNKTCKSRWCPFVIEFVRTVLGPAASFSKAGFGAKTATGSGRKRQLVGRSIMKQVMCMVARQNQCSIHGISKKIYYYVHIDIRLPEFA